MQKIYVRERFDGAEVVVENEGGDPVVRWSMSHEHARELGFSASDLAEGFARELRKSGGTV